MKNNQGRPVGVHEEAVLLTFTAGDRSRLDDLLDEVDAFAFRLHAAAAAAGGALDGYELGTDEVTFFLYGPDCDRLWNALCPVALTAPLAGVHAQLRHGGLEADPVHVDLSP